MCVNVEVNVCVRAHDGGNVVGWQFPTPNVPGTSTVSVPCYCYHFFPGDLQWTSSALQTTTLSSAGRETEMDLQEHACTFPL